MSDVTPHTIEAERAVLGAILVHPPQLDEVLDVVTPGDFFRDAHRHVYAAMLSLADASVEIDTLMVVERLKREKTLEEVGGPAYVSGLADGVPRSTNARAYASEVRQAADLRRLEAAGQRIAALARGGGDDAKALIDEAERTLFAVSQGHGKSDVMDGAALAARGYPLIEKLLETKRHVTGIPSGYRDFDALTRGFQPGTLSLLAARPSMGKTSFALNIAFNAAEQGIHTLLFSIEMSWEEVFLRLVSSVARIDSHRLQSGHISQSDYARIGDAIGAIAESKLHLQDAAGVSLMDIRGKARRLKAKRGLGLVIVDYLQLMQLPKAENRNIAVSEVSRGLKIVARELDVPLLVLSQLSRDTERRGGNKKPMLSDLRDSGALEQDADLVLFIHRPEVYEPDRPELRGLAELIIAKQRNGPTGTVELSWLREQTRFEARSM